MLKLTSYILTIPLLLIFLQSGYAAITTSTERDNDSYYKQCEYNKTYIIKNSIKVSCLKNYHHYNSSAFKKYYSPTTAQSQVKIANFNLWHPGQRKSIFKDYALVAKIINRWDILSALELQAVVGPDLAHNTALLKFIATTPTKIKKLQNKLAITTAPKERANLLADIAKLTKELKQAPSLYRQPGYISILIELRKLDPSWALLLSSKGEAARERNVQELTGFFYRATKVRPQSNPFCRQYKTRNRGNPFGCTPDFDGKFLDIPYKNYFSRRPFMGSFSSGEFAFTLIASHFVFNSPRDPAIKQAILKDVFNATTIEELGKGVYPTNYARLAELKMTMQFLQRYQVQYNDNNLILTGDLNIKSDNPFAKKVINEAGQNNWELLIQKKTSTTYRRFNVSGAETYGLSSNYDHFVIQKNNHFCRNSQGHVNASSYNLMQDPLLKNAIDSKYKIRTEKKNAQNYYIVSSQGKLKGKKLWNSFKARWSARKTIKNGHIVIDTLKQQSTILNFKRRVLDSQLQDRTYYRYIHEVISDHLPIQMTCDNI